MLGGDARIAHRLIVLEPLTTSAAHLVKPLTAGDKELGHNNSLGRVLLLPGQRG